MKMCICLGLVLFLQLGGLAQAEEEIEDGRGLVVGVPGSEIETFENLLKSRRIVKKSRAVEPQKPSFDSRRERYHRRELISYSQAPYSE